MIHVKIVIAFIMFLIILGTFCLLSLPTDALVKINFLSNWDFISTVRALTYSFSVSLPSKNILTKDTQSTVPSFVALLNLVFEHSSINCIGLSLYLLKRLLYQYSVLIPDQRCYYLLTHDNQCNLKGSYLHQSSRCLYDVSSIIFFFVRYV